VTDTTRHDTKIAPDKCCSALAPVWLSEFDSYVVSRAHEKSCLAFGGQFVYSMPI
jgi:hypothetical protein